MPELKKPHYLRRIARFYGRPHWVSLLTTLYLVWFAYFSVYHLNNIILAIKFIFHTLRIATSLLELSYLLWGVLFIISLILPFTISFSALFFPYEVWRTDWNTERKILIMALLIVTVLLAVSAIDELIKIIALQEPLQGFVIKNQLQIGRRLTF